MSTLNIHELNAAVKLLPSAWEHSIYTVKVYTRLEQLRSPYVSYIEQKAVNREVTIRQITFKSMPYVVNGYRNYEWELDSYE